MAFGWPAWLIPPALPVFYLQNASRSGGAALNGQEQTVSSMSARWSATFADMPIRSQDEMLAYEAFLANFEGRANVVIAPTFVGSRANWPVDIYGRKLTPAFTRHKQLDGTIYADAPIPAESQIIARFSAAVARRATIVSLQVVQGSPIKVGQLFSPRLGVLHRITEDLGGGQYRIKPPLRYAEIINTPVDFMRPTCAMKLASDEEGVLSPRSYRYGTASLTLEEAF